MKRTPRLSGNVVFTFVCFDRHTGYATRTQGRYDNTAGQRRVLCIIRIIICIVYLFICIMAYDRAPVGRRSGARTQIAHPCPWSPLGCDMRPAAPGTSLPQRQWRRRRAWASPIVSTVRVGRRGVGQVRRSRSVEYVLFVFSGSYSREQSCVLCIIRIIIYYLFIVYYVLSYPDVVIKHARR